MAARFATFTAIAALGLAGHAGAQNLDAHEHGVGVLNLAIEGDEVEMELTAPGADIVGFEHMPGNEEQEKTVEGAVHLLEDLTALFEMPAAAGCELEEVEIESALIGDHHDDDHAHGDEEKHDDHDDGHKDDDHAHDHKDDDHKDDDHAHGEKHDDHAHEDAEEHAEFKVHYHLECSDVNAIDIILVRYFESFPNARELRVQALLPSGQAAMTLTPEDKALALR